MKVLVLLIYNETILYRQMLEIQKKYIHNNPNVDCYFVTMDEKQKHEISIKDNIISIKGKECLLNITFKTIKAFNYILNIQKKQYDYVVRSNVSTMIHFKNLLKYLESLPTNCVYVGGNIQILQWLDHKAGINEDTYAKYNLQDLKYVQGTGIIMSIDVIRIILANKNKLKYHIVDDVTFGMFIRDYMNRIYNNISSDKFCKILVNDYDENCVFIRNKTSDNPRERHSDLERMTTFANNLISQQ